jgi:hypothetical protein
VSGPARLVVQVWHGDVVVHEFSRSTAQPTASSVRKMADSALGWLQAWSGQLADAQWAADVAKAREAQRLAEQPNDGILQPPQAA